MKSNQVFKTWSTCELSKTIRTLLLLLGAVTIIQASTISSKALSHLSSQSAAPINELDIEIQRYAFQSFKHSATGTIYTVTLPSNLTGLKVEAVRLRSGSLRRHGFTFNEFLLPMGSSIATPSPVRVLLIYRQFTSIQVYTPPTNYTLIAPVVGIKIYSAANLTATDELPELDLTTLQDPIRVSIPQLKTATNITPFCVSFETDGRVVISNATVQPNVCSFTHLGDFSLAIPESNLAPVSSTGSSAMPGSRRRRNAWKIALGSGVGVFVVIAMAALMVMVKKSVERKRIAKMETESERGEVLQTTAIGPLTRTPTAGIIRTRPTLEHDYSL